MYDRKHKKKDRDGQISHQNVATLDHYFAEEMFVCP
jgi:hypothetical protein